MRKLVKIYSNEHEAWWKPSYAGYAQDEKLAGIFDYDEAKKKYPKIGYNDFEEDFFVDICELDLRNELSDIEYAIYQLRNKAEFLKSLLGQAGQPGYLD